VNLPDRTALKGLARKPLVLVAGVVALAVVVTGVLLLGGGGGGGDGARPKDAAAVSEEPLPDGPLAEEAPTEEPPSEKPTEVPQATALSGEKLEPDPEVTAPIKEDSLPPYANGCDYGYDAGGKCVPWTFPLEVETPLDRCEWLLDQGFPAGIKVKDQDRHQLDPDKNGTACDGELTPKPMPDEPL
jgi:hypothetical protein